jgi:hypothetical protein
VRTKTVDQSEKRRPKTPAPLLPDAALGPARPMPVVTHGHLLRPQKPCIPVQEHPLLMEQSNQTPITDVIKQEQSCFSIVTNT